MRSGANRTAPPGSPFGGAQLVKKVSQSSRLSSERACFILPLRICGGQCAPSPYPRPRSSSPNQSIGFDLVRSRSGMSELSCRTRKRRIWSLWRRGETEGDGDGIDGVHGTGFFILLFFISLLYRKLMSFHPLSSPESSFSMESVFRERTESHPSRIHRGKRKPSNLQKPH